MPSLFIGDIDRHLHFVAGNNDTGRGRGQFKNAQGFRGTHDVDGDEAASHVTSISYHQ